MAFFTRYVLPEKAQCEADSVKALGYPDECKRITPYGVRSPKKTQDYALCKEHRVQLAEKGLYEL